MSAKRALIIGGSGMLKGVSRWFNEMDYTVYIIGRDRRKLENVRIESKHPENSYGISVDYRDSEQLKQQLTSVLAADGVPDIVVSWIHSTAPNALSDILNVIQDYHANNSWHLFHVQSSARFWIKENTPVPKKCLYRRVYLGFIVESNHSRWLTHEEISDGVIQAIKSDKDETVVGTLEPWDKRP
ncbi:MAG TPA: short-chain dehydrogenase [Lentibacillus sp.]|uniref:short-chain dehydrogenase n=1 Tax=Lentibacillus sp. TaxID=1925746 RepID=UPI002B4B7181|nr:short-chain dehydrogenase [Lentibacillus sp.]HLR60806.1 short-chain dehydrogenase [Lentibacillus sp.]